MELKEMIYRTYCCITSDIMNAGNDIVPSTAIARNLKISLYQVRKAIKELVQEGLLMSAMEGGYSEYSCQVYCIRGYRLTEKGRSTFVFKQEKWKNAKRMAKVFGGTAISYYL